MGNEVKDFVDRPFFKTLGWICTIASLLTGIYFTLFYKPSAHFEYEIISKTLILNRNVDVPSIRIMIDSLDVQRDSLNISIMEIKISNTGQDHLRREDYDNSTFGLEIINGRLLERPEISASSSDYILRCCKEHSFEQDSTFISIPTIPLDSKDYYQFKLVVLHNVDKNLSFTPHGKIIGQREICVLENRSMNEPFWKRVFDENPWIHILRSLIYLVLFISVICIIIFIDSQIDENKRKKKRKTLIQKLRSNKQLDDEIVNDFLIMNSRDFNRMIDLLNLSEAELYNKYKASINYTRNENNRKNDYLWKMHHTRFSTIKMMLEKGYIKIEEERLKIIQKKKKSLLIIKQEAIDCGLYIPERHIDREQMILYKD